MKLKKEYQFVIYALKEYLKKINLRFEYEPLEASVSKIDFIRLMQNLDITDKSQRGLYKNLEILEKKKLIRYENKFLKLTEKGLKVVKEKEIQILPYMKLISTLENRKNPAKIDPQSYFK